MPQPDNLARIFRARYGQLIAALVANCGDLQLAEDALQHAFLQASEKWADDNAPGKPEAWLFTVAKRHLIDRLRQSSRQSAEHTLTAISESMQLDQAIPEGAQTIPDERLKLIFTCCHPALKPAAQVALTLKTLCGISAREIARAYLVSETTMNQRLVRAKKKIRKAGIAYEVPEGEALTDRLTSVLAVIYLIYNESYSAFEGQTLTRKDLAEEAIRLARVLHRLLPATEVSGLLALMLLQQSRQPARSNHEHAFIPLEQQNRALWDKHKISEGRTILLGALAQGKPGKYQLQAAISALHSEAESWQQTDWQQITLLYLALHETEPSPIVKLNGLVAMAQSGRDQEAHEQIKQLADQLAEYQPFYAAKAELECRLSLIAEAKLSYRQAIRRSKNQAEKKFLEERLAKINK